MCEFKIVDKKVNNQLAEDVVLLSYSNGNTLLLKDILGIANEAESALIYEVNTLDQTCTIIQHPIVNPFISLLEKINDNTVTSTDIEQFQSKLEELKKDI
jgi:hypothetical protein